MRGPRMFFTVLVATLLTSGSLSAQYVRPSRMSETGWTAMGAPISAMAGCQGVFLGSPLSLVCDESGPPAATNPGLSWSPESGYGFADPKRWTAYDAGAVGGRVTKRYWGAVRYLNRIIFIPGGGGFAGGAHGIFMEYNTALPFDSPGSWKSYDAGTTDGLNTKGYAGGTIAWPYAYFSPHEDDVPVNHGRVLRLDLRKALDDPSAWEAYDASATSGLDCKGYRDALYDGRRYVIFAPFRSGGVFHGNVLFFDTWAAGGFKDAGSWFAYDAGATSGLVSKGYKSLIRVLDFVYFCPNNNNGVTQAAIFLRLDLKGDPTAAGSWSAVSAPSASGLSTKGYSALVFDGQEFIYGIPIADASSSHGRLIRYSIRRAWTAGSFQAFDMGAVGGANTRGYLGAVIVGKWLVLAPYYQGIEGSGGNHHGIWVAYDMTKSFFAAASYTTFDGSLLNSLDCEGMAGVIFDGRFVYGVPHKNDTETHGHVSRWDSGAPDEISRHYLPFSEETATELSVSPATLTQAGAYWQIAALTYAPTGFSSGGGYTTQTGRWYGPKWITLADATPATVAILSVPASGSVTAEAIVEVDAGDGTERQGMSYHLRINTSRKATGNTVSAQGLVDEPTTAPGVVGGGTLACTFGVVEGASAVSLTATCSSSLAETTLRALAQMTTVGTGGVVTYP